MGCFTTYNLSINIQNDDIISEFVSENEDAADAIDVYGNSIDIVKWYDHEEHLREFSKNYPTLIFRLEGEGENYDDIWIKYFKNGLCQTCKAIITFDPFDESKLK